MNLFEEVKKRVNILDVVNDFGIKVSRGNFISSIYKDEKNPSLKLYPSTNSYYDFSSGRGGDVIDFYKDYCGIDIKQAVKELAHKAGIDGKWKMGNGKWEGSKPPSLSSSKGRTGERKRVSVLKSEMEFFDERAGIYEYMMGLDKNKAEIKAMKDLINERKEIQSLIYESFEKFCFGLDDEAFDYLVGKERGLKPETIKRFRVFAVKNKKQVFEYLQDCFSKNQLLIAGIINMQGYFVFTYHRLIIPYVEKNKIIYLRGRTVGSNESLSKYISLTNYASNLTLKRFFNKNVLNEIRLGEKLIIAEGEFDTMILEQEGYKALGVPGVTNIPVDEIHQLKEYNIHLAFDNDKAGALAMQKITNLLNKPVKVIKLKNHNDITELVNERHSGRNF